MENYLGLSLLSEGYHDAVIHPLGVLGLPGALGKVGLSVSKNLLIGDGAIGAKQVGGDRVGNGCSRGDMKDSLSSK